jgi:FkbM family methyltransferase
MIIIKNKICFYRNFLASILEKYRIKIILNRNNFEKILAVNFDNNDQFSFIQVGANDGINFDILYDFVIKKKSSGIVIEPIKEYFDQLEKNYIDFKEIVKINKAVHSFEKTIKLYKVKSTAYHKYPLWVKGITSLNFTHHSKLNIDDNDIEEVDVEAENLMEIIKKNYNSVRIDLLQIDTEGYDHEIIKMIDFKLIKPKIIKYEYVSLSDSEISFTRELLNKNGYFTFEEGGDIIAVDLKRVMLF